MAMLKDTLISGDLRVTGTIYGLGDNLTELNADHITSGVVSVANGGTGASTLTSGEVLIGNGTNAITTKAIDTTTGGTADSTSLITSGAVHAALAGSSSFDLPLARGTSAGSLKLTEAEYLNTVSGIGSITFGNGNHINGNRNLALSGVGAVIQGNDNISLISAHLGITLTGEANATTYTTTRVYKDYESNAFIGKSIIRDSDGVNCARIVSTGVNGNYLTLTLDQTLSTTALSNNADYAISGATVYPLTTAHSNVVSWWGHCVGGSYNFICGTGGISASNGSANFLFGPWNSNLNNKNFVTMFGGRLSNTNTDNTFIIGQYNEPDSTSLPHAFVIGGGSESSATTPPTITRTNIFSIDKSGNIDTVNNITMSGTLSTPTITADDITVSDIFSTSKINAPTASNGTTLGPGSNGQVLMSNGSSVYWGTVSGGGSGTAFGYTVTNEVLTFNS